MALLFILIVFCSVFTPLQVSGQTICTSTEIRTEVYIKASPEEVWEMLLAVDEYSTWHPYLIGVEGDLSVGSRIKVELREDSSSNNYFHAYIIELEPNQLLSWGGSLGFLFRAKHYYILQSEGVDSTLFIQGEYWRGWLGKTYGKRIYEETWEKFHLMNNRMKEILEASKS